MEKLIYDIRELFASEAEEEEKERAQCEASGADDAQCASERAAASSDGGVMGENGAVRKLLENYKSNPQEWRKYAQFDPLQYTRNLIDLVEGKYNLLILCWGPGQFSGIHDHTDSHCFVKVLQGQLLETRYAWPTAEYQPLVEIGSDLYKTNEVTYISDQIGLHRMENDSHTDGTVTLHLYTPPLTHCQIFDLRTGVRDHRHSSYYSKYGEKVDAKTGVAAQTTPSVTVAGSSANSMAVPSNSRLNTPIFKKAAAVVREFKSG